MTKAFAILKRHKLRLNVAKCTFGMSLEKFLGHLVTKQRIEVKLDQIITINNFVSPRNTKDVQKLTEIVAALNGFISKSFNKCKSV